MNSIETSTFSLKSSGEKVRLTHRITAALKNDYPQVLDWFEDKDTQVFCLFVERYPTLKAAQAATSEELTQFFTRHKVVRRTAMHRRIEQIAQSRVLTEEAAIVELSQGLVQVLMTQLKGLLKTLDEINDKITALFAAHPDAEFFITKLTASELHLETT